MKQFLLILAFLFCASTASATTYYISYSSGSNANDGLAEVTGSGHGPWKSHPYMQTASGCTGTGSAPAYSHVAGDQFVFKQGDSWPNACFDMSIQAGGASGNPDVYTFDPTWGTAGGTTGNTGQAVGTYQFNAGGVVMNGTDGWNAFIRNNSNSYITLNGMELTGQTWTGTNSATGITAEQGTYVIISNIYVHGWTHPGATVDGLIAINGNQNTPHNLGVRLTGSVIDGLNSGGSGVSDSGDATFAIPLSDNNIIKNMSNGLLLGNNPVAYSNQIGPINPSFQTAVHENCIEPIAMGTVYIYNNIWHDCTAVALLTQGASAGPGTEIDYIWNNVAYVGSFSSPAIPFDFDSVSTTNSTSEVHAWNNTIYGGTGTVCMRTVNRGNGNFGVLDLQNNHCISDSGLITLGISGNTYTNVDNLLMGTALAATDGYTLSETYIYSPPFISSPTVGAGTNLTSLATGAAASLANDTTYGGPRTTNARPSTGAWDVGAYEFSGAAPSNNPFAIDRGFIIAF